MKFLFILIGALGGAVFGILSAGFIPNKTASGAVAPEAKLVVTGIVLCTALVLVGNKIGEHQAERDATQRHEAILATVMREARRVDPSTIRVVLSYDISFMDGSSVEGPQFLNGTWIASLNVQREKPEKPLNRWSPYQILGQHGIRLMPATTRTYPRTQYRHGGGYFTTCTEVFTDFVGDLGIFADATAWNDCYVELHLESKNRAQAVQDWVTGWHFEQHARHGRADAKEWIPSTDVYDIDPYDLELDPHYREIPYLAASAQLHVGGRTVGVTTGRITACLDGAVDLEDAIIKFPIVHIAPDAFPVLGQGPARTQSRSAFLICAAWVNVAGIIVVATALAWRLW